jgi:hypothetical protein
MSVEALAAAVEERPSWPVGWEDWPVTADAHYLASEQLLQQLGANIRKGAYQGQGVVLAGGGAAFFLRSTSPFAPARDWLSPAGSGLVSRPQRRNACPFCRGVGSYAAQCIDADDWRAAASCRILNG